MIYYSCSMIESMFLNFNGRIDTNGKPITLCCEAISDIPGIAFAETPEQTIRNFIGERAFLIAESRRNEEASSTRKHFTAACQKCAQYQKKEWGSDGRIHYVNLSMYPAPCQCRCIYCGVHKDYKAADTKEAQNRYEKLFDIVEYAKDCGLIAPNSTWQVSSGEITIHPYRKRIMELVRGERAVFYTNVFQYDEDIAQNLQDNPNSAINLSIDAGTPETWRKVKGFDNFEKVTDNLVKYFSRSARPGQITLKYIVLPDMNDSYEDFVSCIEIMKVLQVPHLTLSRDTTKKYNMTSSYRKKLVGGAAYLLALCHKSGISNDMFTYSPAEQKDAVVLANEILQKGLI